MLANRDSTATVRVTGMTRSPASRLLQMGGVSYGAGERLDAFASKPANAMGQVGRDRGLIFFAGKRAPTLDPGRLRHLRHKETCGLRESVGAGLLANRDSTAMVRVTGMTRPPASRLLPFGVSGRMDASAVAI